MLISLSWVFSVVGFNYPKYSITLINWIIIIIVIINILQYLYNIRLAVKYKSIVIELNWMTTIIFFTRTRFVIGLWIFIFKNKYGFCRLLVCPIVYPVLKRQFLLNSSLWTIKYILKKCED
jgi:hypothetical protein